jgi:RNase H-fold protein (predicted Holliday junction resolvase)
MDISITAVTGNRLFTKAMFRIAEKIRPLKAVAEDIDTNDESFDTLQLVFEDHDDDYLELIGTKKGDRLFQVAVGIPTSVSLKRNSDEELVKEMAKRLREAVESCPLVEDKKRIILERITKAITH